MRLLKSKYSTFFKVIISSILVMSTLIGAVFTPMSIVSATDYLSFYEAEDVTPIDGATWTVAEDADASGGKVASGTKSQEFILENVAESNKVILKYSGSNSGSAKVFLKEGELWRELGSITFATTQSFEMNRGKEVSLEGVYIPAGATIKIIPQNETNLDYFRFNAEPLNSQEDYNDDVLFAVNAQLENGAAISDELMSSLGKAVLLSTAGAEVTFSMPDTLDLSKLDASNVRYYAESEAVIEYYLDGEPIKQYTLPACLNHDYYFVPGLDQIAYTAQTTITIKLISGSVYLDYIELINKLDPSQPREIAMPSNNSNRSETSLDGVWLATKADAVKPSPSVTVPDSTEFAYTAPVPGLWDMVTPTLGDLGQHDLWYQTTVIMPDDYSPEGDYIVELKINRAVYGRTVFVNGQYADHYAYNHSISYSDISDLLIPGENTISVMVGYQGGPFYDDSVKPAYGKDPERTEYLIGITDSVSVVVNKAPQIDTVQTAPDIYNGTVTVQAGLSNTSGKAITTDVTFNIYELGVYKNGVAPYKNLVGTYTKNNVTVGISGRTTVNVADIKISNFKFDEKAWSPDNPFLYQVEVITSGDTLVERFGMKEFTFDPETKQPMLNGKVYRLLGTNVVLGRFFCDPNHEDYAWQEDWVRQLYTTFKETNWEVYRSHVGPVPEMWYDLADEMGMMIVDEYGWWYDAGTTPQVIANEYMTTIDQRQTHPSIIFWDAQNETGSWDHTNIALGIIGMDYDISQRCWDNGMQVPLDENQPTEYHPYPFWGMLNLTDVAKLNNMTDQYPSGGGQHTADTYPNPIIINEYAELWLNRNGDPTTISRTSYESMLPDATADERLEWYADFIAILTEFWRAGRNIAGIQYFSGLTYSLPTSQGATGDLLLPDISTPQVRPETQKRVKDAFAKLGICIQKYDVTTVPGLDFAFPVTLYNDLNEEVNDLEVLFKVTCNGRVLAEETAIYNLAAAGDVSGDDLQSKTFTFVTPTNLNNDDVILVTASYMRDGETVESVRKLVCQDFEDNSNIQTEEIVSIGKPTEASSYDNNLWYLAPKYVVDGITDSSGQRWGATPKSENEWITVDLGISKEITKVKLYWTNFAYGKEYKIQISDDNATWTDVAHVTDGASADIREFKLPENTIARYVRMQGIMYGGGSSAYSLYEFEVYAKKIEMVLASVGKSIEASSYENNTWYLAPKYVVDGISDSSGQRWGSEKTNDEWLTVDMGIVRPITRVNLYWTTFAYGKEYKIQVSDDNATWTDIIHKTGGKGGLDSFDFPADINARYVRMLGIECATAYSMYEFEVYTEKVDMLLYSNGKKMETSGIIAWWGAAGNANDGNLESRWCSPDNVPDSWITVDLGKKREIAKVDIMWMNYSTGKEYKIQVSDDNINWTDAFHYQNGAAGTHSIDLPSGIFGRYVRMQGIESRSTSYSIFELYIYVKIDEKNVNFESITLDKDTVSINLADKSTAQLYAYTNPIDANNIHSCSWSSDNEAVATVNEKGCITAVTSGKATVTYSLSTADGNIYSASCEVTVINENVDITSPLLPIIDKLTAVDCDGTTVADLKNMFSEQESLEILNIDGSVASSTDTIKTGMIINKKINGQVSDSVTVVVRGDVTKSGDISSSDALLIKQIMLGLHDIDNIIRTAADFDGNGKITAYDLLSIKFIALSFD